MVSVSLEAETKRNNIPDKYRADAASSGALTGSFSHNAYEFQSTALANISESSSAAPIILSGSQQAIKQHQLTETTRKKREREAHFVNVLDRLSQRLEELNELIDETTERLDQINDRQLEIGDQLEALDELDELSNTGQLDTHNPIHQRIMKRAGISPEAPAADIAVLISEQRAVLGREHDDLEDENNTLIRRRDELEAEREQVLTVMAEIENADTPEARAIAEQRAQNILDHSELTDLAAQTDDQELKAMAAKAVAQTDNGDVSTNLAETKLAVSSSKEDFVDSDADSFSFDAPSPS